MIPEAWSASARSGSAAVDISPFDMSIALLVFALLAIPVAALCQEADSAQVMPPDSAQVVPPDSVAVGADSASVSTDSVAVVGAADSLAATPPDSSGLFAEAPMRFYDPPPGPRLSPLAGKSVKRERGDLLAFSTTTWGETYAYEPGIDLLEYGSAGLPQALRVRGSRPKDVMYLMDGIPVSDERLEIFDQNWLPLAGMVRAEVAMNGQSGLYGSGATGGVMNLETMSAMPRVPTSEFVAWWGSFGSRAINFRFNRRITSRFGILLSFENLHSGGWTESSEANSNKFFGKLTGFLGRGVTYNVVGYRYDGSIELPDSCPGLPGTQPAARDDKRDFVHVSLAGGDETSIRFDYSYLGVERDYRSGSAAGSGEGHLNGFLLTATTVTEDSLTAVLGAGLKRYKLRENDSEKHSTNDMYGYLAGEMPIGDWLLRGSFRVERNSRSGTELAGDLGASFRASKWVVIFGRIDRSFAFPSLRGLSARTEDPKGTAEHWSGFELGTDLGTDPVRLSATLFARKVDNSTMLALGEDGDCEWPVPVGGQEVDYLGAEALLSFAYAAWLEGSLGYSAERGRDGDGESISYVSPGTFTWDLRANTKFSGHVSAGIRFAGRWAAPLGVGNQRIPCSEGGCAHDAELDGYVAGLLYGYIDIDSGRVYARVRNLFNQGITQIWGNHELPPRSYEFGVNLELFD